MLIIIFRILWVWLCYGIVCLFLKGVLGISVKSWIVGLFIVLFRVFWYCLVFIWMVGFCVFGVVYGVYRYFGFLIVCLCKINDGVGGKWY